MEKVETEENFSCNLYQRDRQGPDYLIKEDSKGPKAYISPTWQRYEDLDLFSRREELRTPRPRIAYWIPHDIPHKNHKSLPGVSLLGNFGRMTISQNGIGEFLLYAGGYVIFKAKEGRKYGETGPPSRESVKLINQRNEEVLTVQRAGKLECKVTCTINDRFLGSILQIGVQKGTYILGNEESQKIAQIQKIFKRDYFAGCEGRDNGILEYEFRTVEDEPVGGGIFFFAKVKCFGNLTNPKSCSIRFPDKVGPAEKALFLAAAFFFDFLEFKIPKPEEVDEAVAVVPFIDRQIAK